MIDKMKKSKLNYLADEGHYSILMNQRDEILKDLLNA